VKENKKLKILPCQDRNGDYLYKNLGLISSARVRISEYKYWTLNYTILYNGFSNWSLETSILEELLVINVPLCFSHNYLGRINQFLMKSVHRQYQ